MTDVNSSRTPRWMSRKRGIMPMPSGRMRHNSSMEPGRMVGLMLPTTPRQDVKATGYPLIVAKTAEIEVPYGDYSVVRPPCCAGLPSVNREAADAPERTDGPLPSDRGYRGHVLRFRLFERGNRRSLRRQASVHAGRSLARDTRGCRSAFEQGRRAVGNILF